MSLLFFYGPKRPGLITNYSLISLSNQRSFNFTFFNQMDSVQIIKLDSSFNISTPCLFIFLFIYLLYSLFCISSALLFVYSFPLSPFLSPFSLFLFINPPKCIIIYSYQRYIPNLINLCVFRKPTQHIYHHHVS